MRGISPIVATVLLIAIVVAIGALLYMGVAQMLENTPTKEKAAHTIMFDAYAKEVPPGTYGFYFHYYVPVSTQMNWIDAFNYCKERGMFLTMPRNRDQLNRLIGILKEKGWSMAWIGVYLQPGVPKAEGEWYYLTGEEVPDFLWAPGQPSIALDYETVGAVATTPYAEGVHDFNGETSLPFFCEGIRIGFSVSNLSSKDNFYLYKAVFQLSSIGGSTITSVPADSTYFVDVNIGGTVHRLDIRALRCGLFTVPPTKSTVCNVWAIPYEVSSVEPDSLRVCLIGEGVRVCDIIP